MEKTMNAEKRQAIYAAMRELRQAHDEALSSGRHLVNKAVKAMPTDTTFTASQISATVGLPHQSVWYQLYTSPILREETRQITQRYVALNDDGSINQNQVIQFTKKQRVYVKRSGYRDTSANIDEVRDILSQLGVKF